MPHLTVHRFAPRTVPALLCDAARRLPGEVFLHFLDPARPGEPPTRVTFAGLRDAAGRAAALLERAGVAAGDRVLLLAENSPGWQIMALGAQLLRAEPAALFASLAAEPARAVALRVRPRAVFVSGAAQWEKLAPAGAELAAAGLSLVVAGEPLAPGAVPPGVRTATLADLAEAAAPEAAEIERRAAAVGEEDPFLLLFTSGTTGRPKGVRLPQRALVHAIDAGHTAVGTGRADRDSTSSRSRTWPGRTSSCWRWPRGTRSSSIARREDLERRPGLRARPTCSRSRSCTSASGSAVEARIDGLPALLRGLVRAGAGSPPCGCGWTGSAGLGDRALAAPGRPAGGQGGAAEAGRPRARPVLGGRAGRAGPFAVLRGAGDPVRGAVRDERDRRPHLLEPVARARAAPAAPACPPRTTGSASRADGELQLQGPLLLSGYLDPEDTREAFTEDGWFRTGDVVRQDERGELWVEGRKKHLLVLSTGKKLSPEPIEAAIAAARPFQGAVLLGEGRPFVSAAVFVAQEILRGSRPRASTRPRRSSRRSARRSRRSASTRSPSGWW